MTIRYVGPGGNNSNSGLTWALRKLTLNGVEDTPVVAGDFVWVGPGTYRELLTVDVSGTSGNPITYAGDYTGINTDGVGGVVRVTGSDNDQTGTRTSCIGQATTGRNYRTFQGLRLDTTTASGSLITSSSLTGTNWTIQNCIGFWGATGAGILVNHSGNLNWTIKNCVFFSRSAGGGIACWFTNGSTVDNSGHVVQNCIFLGGSQHVGSIRIGGITVKNCVSLFSQGAAHQVNTALSAGQTMTVNNCIMEMCATGCSATVSTEFAEDYNSFFNNTTNRTNVNTGANSNTFPAMFDSRWFFQLVSAGAGPSSAAQVVTPFDLASFSQLINVAGTSPTTSDMRGTEIQGSQREWGALEYDSTLKVSGVGGGMIRNPGMSGGLNG